MSENVKDNSRNYNLIIGRSDVPYERRSVELYNDALRAALEGNQRQQSRNLPQSSIQLFTSIYRTFIVCQN